MSNSKLAQYVNHLDYEYVIYCNLPNGGARKTFLALKLSLSKNLKVLKGITTRPINILHYMYIALIGNYIHDLRLSKTINSKSILIFFQSWLIKSPYLLCINHNAHKFYICHEPMREYYDERLLELKSWKEHAIDIIRYPLKIVDHIIATRTNAIFISNSVYSKKRIISAYNRNSIVVYPGYDSEIFRHSNLSKKKNQIISVGAINKYKNQMFLIEVISKIDINRPKLLLVGNGLDKSYVRELRVLAIKLNVDLEIKINVSDSKLKELYSESILMMYAPVSEPFGIVILEALAMGLPLAYYSRGGGYTEILDDENGLMFDALDSDIWATKISKLLNDSNLKDRIKKMNINLAKKYTNIKYVKNIRTVISRYVH